ncbi:head GIN domain-containing protein [Gilvibacter sediminis]|uniref:head GIN domain-containing protein n=1 Tax=Gilvibacter sediminis TaxID=379071 RepID=UPI002350D5DE|nr:head GIN domain-containing protein [Gilvibacter sediminis]MDC7997770.1 DUF2807 domain-containing protein [Gilvibacter sediminis]
MKTTIKLLSVLFILSALPAQAQWGSKKVKGNGNVTTETVSTGDYDVVAAVGPMDVYLVSGTEGTISVEADSNFHEYIEIETNGDQLVVKIKKNYNLKSKNPIKVTVPFEDLSGVKLTGSGDVMTRDAISADNFNAAVTGSGDVSLEVNADNASFKITGSGDMRLKGSADMATLKISGSGDFDGKMFRTQNAEVSISGSGDATVFAEGNLKARVNGSGDITYGGNPNVDKKVSGSGTISSRN